MRFSHDPFFITTERSGMKLWQNIKISLIIVTIIWAVFILNLFLPIDLRMYGLRPSHINGLWGILFMPFLHGNLAHIIANTGALFVLLAIALSYDRKMALKALIIIMILGGGLVWLFGWLLGNTDTVHVGASGMIFGLIGYLMFLGIFRKEWKAFILSSVICFFYGGALLSLLIYVPGVSWTGHFFGFLSGIFAAKAISP